MYPKCRLPGSALGVTRERRAFVVLASGPSAVGDRPSVEQGGCHGGHDRDRSAQALAHRGRARQREQDPGAAARDRDRRQIDRLLAFATPWPQRVWAVENANGLGRLLSRQLLDAGETVVDVPAKL